MKKSQWRVLGAIAGLVSVEAAARIFARPWPTLDDFALRPETLARGAGRDCRLRVLVVGDSIVYGKDVSYGEAYPALLERMWQDSHPEDPLAFINAGADGMTVLQGIQLLPVLTRRFRPHVVLIAFGLNDGNLSRSFLDEKREAEFMPSSWVRALRHSRLFAGLERRWRRRQANRAFWLANRPEPRVSEDAFVRALGEMVEHVRERGAVPVLLTTTPLSPDFRPEVDGEARERLWPSCEHYNALIRQVSETAETYLIDVHAGLALEPPDTAQDGVHLTSGGYRKLASYLLTKLESVLC